MPKPNINEPNLVKTYFAFAEKKFPLFLMKEKEVYFKFVRDRLVQIIDVQKDQSPIEALGISSKPK
jgi:hypothetical protein